MDFEIIYFSSFRLVPVNCEIVSLLKRCSIIELILLIIIMVTYLYILYSFVERRLNNFFCKTLKCFCEIMLNLQVAIL